MIIFSKKRNLINLCKKIPIFFSQYNKCIEIIITILKQKKLVENTTHTFRVDTELKHITYQNKDVQH